MKSDTLLDHAVFQLSPRRSRCDLFVFGKGKTDKLASGFVMPFVTHLKAAEEQIALSVQAIKLKVERCRNSKAWFTKGTLERFVRFVSTPEILEFVNTLDSEMSQLEAAQKIYSQGASDHLPGTGGSNSGARTKADETKKELLRAIDLRLSAVRQDLSAAFSHAASAGFDLVTVTELQMFADQFSAHRLNEACHKFLSFCNRRVDLTDEWKYGSNRHTFLSSNESEISIDVDPTTKTNLYAGSKQQPGSHVVTYRHLEETTQPIIQKGKNSSISSQVCFSRGSGVEKEDIFKHIKPVVNKDIKERRSSDRVNSVPSSQHVRRPRMQDRIKRSEIKKDDSGRGGKPVIEKSAPSRRHSSQDKAVPRRWSCVSDTSRVLVGDKTDTGSLIRTRSSATEGLSLGDSASHSRDQVEMQSLVRITGSGEEISGLKPSTFSTSKLTDASVGTQLAANSSPVEYGDRKNQNQWYPKVKLDFNWEEHDKDQTSSDVQFKSNVNTALKINVERVLSDHEQVKGIIGNSSENDSSYGKSTFIFSCENVSTTSDCHDSYSTPPASQIQRVKSKENLELNDKLNMKANELEKLFAEHKLRVPGESSSNRRSWVAGFSSEPAANSFHQTSVIDAAPVQFSYNYISVEPAKDFSSIGNFSRGPMTELLENHGDVASNHFSEFSFSESSRGKYYDTYLQRRNKKLRDEWSSRREEKEAKFKSMQDSFECSMAEIKAKFSCSTNRHNSESTRR
ncbi:hypothetical protein LIER_06396 [Lithospermum erythrorhizon]|uniref:Uncharacterized protein n=1 Tax=Lithospermum erythrorhizon TaxID=34254 RepID=A0AAV3P484_LITER